MKQAEEPPAGAGPRRTSQESAPPSIDTPVMTEPSNEGGGRLPASGTPASAERPHVLFWVLQTPEAQTSWPTAAVHFERLAGLLGSGVPLTSWDLQVPVPPALALHQSPDPHSLLVVQVSPQAPVERSQTRPACAAPEQSEFTVHLPHDPDAKQTGADADAQSSECLVPRSPLHPTQALFAVSHRGVAPLHVAALVAVQATHWLVVAEQAGVAPLQLESAVQGSHLPAFPPVATQTPERQAPPPASPAEQASPLATPQRLSFASHAPEAQALAPRVAVQAPPGTGREFATFAWQTGVPASPTLSHHSPGPQMASVEQVFPQDPVAVSQRGPAWFPAQSVSDVHRPHVPAVWQYGEAPVGHAAVAVVPWSPLQTEHWLFVTEQAGAADVAQSALVRQLPHVPFPRPLVTQRGMVELRQGAAEVAPKSPSHATQESFVPLVEHAEVTPLHVPWLAAVQGPQVFFAVSHTWDVGQSASETQPPQRLPPIFWAVQPPPPYAKPLENFPTWPGWAL